MDEILITDLTWSYQVEPNFFITAIFTLKEGRLSASCSEL